MNVQHTFDADIDDVLSMMRDPKFLEAIGHAGGPTNVQVTTEGEASVVTAEYSAPDQIKAFVGPTMTMITRLEWTRTPSGAEGVMTVETPRLPTSTKGLAVAKPAADSTEAAPKTEVDYDLDFSITIPLVGKRLEKSLAPHVSEVAEFQGKVGKAYLDAKRDGTEFHVPRT